MAVRGKNASHPEAKRPGQGCSKEHSAVPTKIIIKAAKTYKTHNNERRNTISDNAHPNISGANINGTKTYETRATITTLVGG